MTVDVFINANLLETRLAVVQPRLAVKPCLAVAQDGEVSEVHIERHCTPHLVGNIYLGKVVRVLSGMQGAFVDIGLDKSAWLKANDLNANDLKTNNLKASRTPHNRKTPPISQQLREGEFILVQVIKEALGDKGPRVSMRLRLAARHLVYTPFNRDIIVSKRIRSQSQRQILTDTLKPLLGEQDGYIVRTQAKYTDLDALIAEAKQLKSDWQQSIEKACNVPNTQKKVQCVYQELPLALRFIRDELNADVNRIVVDEQTMQPKLYQQLLEFCQQQVPSLVSKIHLHQGQQALFDEQHIETAIEQALQPQVTLPSGGYIVIESTEAMTTIDINSGSFVGDKSVQRTFLSVNLEAMHIIAKQIRLRQLNGMILIDCIGNMNTSEQKLLKKALEKSLKGDRTKHKIYGFTALGLLEMTRQRTRHTLAQHLTTHCPVCEGTGNINQMETTASMMLKELHYLSAQYTKANLVACMSAQFHDFLQQHDYLKEIKQHLDQRFSIRLVSSPHPTDYKIVME